LGEKNWRDLDASQLNRLALDQMMEHLKLVVLTLQDLATPDFEPLGVLIMVEQRPTMTDCGHATQRPACAKTAFARFRWPLTLVDPSWNDVLLR
jgi:hypothetical protein